jgi:hypothetical protein
MKFVAATIAALAFVQHATAGHVGITVADYFMWPKPSDEQIISSLERVDEYLQDVSGVKLNSLKFFDSNDVIASRIDAILGTPSKLNIERISLTIPNWMFVYDKVDLESVIGIVNKYENNTNVEFIITFGTETYLQKLDPAGVKLMEKAVLDVRARLPNIKITAAFSYAIMDVSYPVHEGKFHDDFVGNYSTILETIDFLTVNTYPMFVAIYNQDQWKDLDLDLLTNTEQRILAQQIDATYSALDKIRGTVNIPTDYKLAIGETGWSSDKTSQVEGIEAELVSLSKCVEYFENSARWMGNSDTIIEGYLFELFDEQYKAGSGIERFFGIFDTWGNFKPDQLAAGLGKEEEKLSVSGGVDAGVAAGAAGAAGLAVGAAGVFMASRVHRDESMRVVSARDIESSPNPKFDI